MTTIVMVTMGEYSDYCVDGIFAVKSPFTVGQQLARYLELHPEQAEPYHGSPQEFTAFLVSEGFLELLETQEIHLGGYGSFGDVSAETLSLRLQS